MSKTPLTIQEAIAASYLLISNEVAQKCFEDSGIPMPEYFIDNNGEYLYFKGLYSRIALNVFVTLFAKLKGVEALPNELKAIHECLTATKNRFGKVIYVYTKDLEANKLSIKQREEAKTLEINAYKRILANCPTPGSITFVEKPKVKQPKTKKKA